jgi:winged helix-turn-helix DNA-binding protein
VTDFLDQKRKEIATRVNELRPLVDEYLGLQAAAVALNEHADSTAAGPTPAAPPMSGQGRDGASHTNPGSNAARVAEALSLVQRQPGITVRELSVQMGIRVHSVNRAVRALEKDARLTRQGLGVHPQRP